MDVRACAVRPRHVSVDGSKDSSIHCLKPEGVAADTAIEKDDNDPFTSANEDKLETNKLAIEDKDSCLHSSSPS